MQFVYLTQEEKQKFDAIASNFREDYTVHTESEVAGFETDEELRMRFSMASFGHDEDVLALAKQIEKGEEIDTLSLESIPEDIAQEFFFTIGARGVTGLMSVLLADGVTTEKQMQLLRDFSVMRHEILIANLMPVSTYG